MLATRSLFSGLGKTANSLGHDVRTTGSLFNYPFVHKPSAITRGGRHDNFSWWEHVDEVRFTNPVQPLEDSPGFLLIVGAIGTSAIYKPCSTARGFSTISRCWSHWSMCDLHNLFNYLRILKYFAWWERMEPMRFTNPVQPLEVSRLFLAVVTIEARAIYTPC